MYGIKEKTCDVTITALLFSFIMEIFFNISSLGLAQALGIEGDREEQKRMGGEGNKVYFQQSVKAR